MTPQEAKDALCKGTQWSDVYLQFVQDLPLIPISTGFVFDYETDAKLRRFFCYDLPLQERWKRTVSTIPNTHKAIHRTQGFEGSPCKVCGAMKVIRTGACLTCQECLSNEGCG